MWQPRAGVEPYPLQIHCRNCADSTLRLIKCFVFVLFILFIYCGNKRNNQPNWTGKVTKSTYSNLTIWPSITRGRGLLGVVLTSWGCQMPQNTCFWHGAWHVLYLTRTIPSNSHAIRAHPLALVHANHIGPPLQDDTCCCTARTDQIRGSWRGAQGVWSQVCSAVGIRGFTLKWLETTGLRVLWVNSVLGLVYLSMQRTDYIYPPDILSDKNLTRKCQNELLKILQGRLLLSTNIHLRPNITIKSSTISKCTESTCRDIVLVLVFLY